MPGQHGVDRVARRARHLADQHALFLQQPVQQRRLADVRPADDGDARSRVGGSRLGLEAGAARPCRSHPSSSRSSPKPWRLSRFTISSSRSPTPVSVLGGDLDDRLESELIELHRRRLRALVVGLVDREQHRHARSARSSRGDRLVARDEPFAAIDEEHQQIGARDRPLPLPDDQLVQRILAGAVQAAGVEQLERRLRHDDRPRERSRASCRRPARRWRGASRSCG